MPCHACHTSHECAATPAGWSCQGAWADARGGQPCTVSIPAVIVTSALSTLGAANNLSLSLSFSSIRSCARFSSPLLSSLRSTLTPDTREKTPPTCRYLRYRYRRYRTDHRVRFTPTSLALTTLIVTLLRLTTCLGVVARRREHLKAAAELLDEGEGRFLRVPQVLALPLEILELLLRRHPKPLISCA